MSMAQATLLDAGTTPVAAPARSKVIAIEAQDLCIEFPIYGQRHRSLRNFIVPKRLAPQRAVPPGAVGGAIAAEISGKVVIKAIDRLSFSLKEGDRLGIMGHNGAGKTTLLRVLAGIYEPTRGGLTVSGRVTPMFSLSDGMDQDATGWENIWLRGAVLGYDHATIARNLDDVAQFSELGDYLDMPVRTYSSGMFVRLGFAIATTLTPEVLVMDEMIGAGDAKFLSRAEARLKQMITRTGLMVVATHSTQILETWCNKAMVLSHGRLVHFGDVAAGIERYQALTQEGG
jgi:ABC-type polysaccharide/polyol phosphate transport system ATPase subunit